MNNLSVRVAVLLFGMVAIGSVGCTSGGSQTITGTKGSNPLSAGKTVALFPTREKTTLTPETVAMLTSACNTTINAKFPGMFPNMKFMSNDQTLDKLSASPTHLDTMTNLFEQHEKTQIYLKPNLKSLADYMKADYLVFSKLSSEKLDVILMRSGTMALDVTILSRSGEKIYQGVGEFRKWGMFGAGKITSSNAAAICDTMFASAMAGYSR